MILTTCVVHSFLCHFCYGLFCYSKCNLQTELMTHCNCGLQSMDWFEKHYLGKPRGSAHLRHCEILLI